MKKIWTPKDGKIDILEDEGKRFVEVKSGMGYPALYPLHEIKIEKPVEAVLMDLDGTSVKSEEFWVWIIESSIARLMGNPRFSLEDADIPHVSGHSVSEHLQYCIDKYCPEKSVEEARRHYYDITDYEMDEILVNHLILLIAVLQLVGNRINCHLVSFNHNSRISLRDFAERVDLSGSILQLVMKLRLESLQTSVYIANNLFVKVIDRRIERRFRYGCFHLVIFLGSSSFVIRHFTPLK